MKSVQSQILAFIAFHQPVAPKQLVENFAIKRVMVQRHLKNLLERGLLEKRGIPPKVFYFTKKTVSKTFTHKYNLESSLVENFLYILPDGTRLDGVIAFEQWCEDRKLDPVQMIGSYQSVLEKSKTWNKGLWIDATPKFRETFELMALEKAFYLDFYALEIFGKTKLGQLVFQAKLNQDLNMIEEVSKIVQSPIQKIINYYEIDAVAFVPHSLKREIQFLSQLKKNLSLKNPEIKMMKLTKDIPIAQKSLPKLFQRIENASKTIFFNPVDLPRIPFERLLVIDDAVGSGSTLNEVAKKAKDKGVAKKIYGLALVGSQKGFDVINEV